MDISENAYKNVNQDTFNHSSDVFYVKCTIFELVFGKPIHRELRGRMVKFIHAYEFQWNSFCLLHIHASWALLTVTWKLRNVLQNI